MVDSLPIQILSTNIYLLDVYRYHNVCRHRFQLCNRYRYCYPLRNDDFFTDTATFSYYIVVRVKRYLLLAYTDTNFIPDADTDI